MLFNVVVLGLVAKVIFGAVDTGRKGDQPNTTNRPQSEINQNRPPNDPLQEAQSGCHWPISGPPLDERQRSAGDRDAGQTFSEALGWHREQLQTQCDSTWAIGFASTWHESCRG